MAHCMRLTVFQFLKLANVHQSAEALVQEVGQHVQQSMEKGLNNTQHRQGQSREFSGEEDCKLEWNDDLERDIIASRE